MTQPKLSAAAEALSAALDKSIGENEEVQGVKLWIDTGDAELNYCISGKYDGGIPVGRIVEMYGPPSAGKTAEATDLLIRVQKMGGVAIFIDWERSFDIGLAKNLGLSDQRPYWIYKTPETWEEGNAQAIRAIELIRASGVIDPEAPILVVLDSIASAVPQSMLYDSKGNKREMTSLTMNDTSALSRVTSNTLKLVAQSAEQNNTTFLYLNQQRTKIGVMFGDPTCLRSDVQVPFVDGTTATIKDVVENKINKEVWSWNEATGKIEPKRIVGWHNNGEIKGTGKTWHHIRAVCPETRNGMVGVTVTNDHKIQIKDKGWIDADKVLVGDQVITRSNRRFSGTALEFLKGVVSFDCHVAKVTAKRQTASLVIQDNENPEYAMWKTDMLSQHLSFTRREITISKNKKGYRFDSNYTNELAGLYDLARTPHVLLGDTWTALQLAIAIMDDGNFKESSKTLNLSFKRLRGNEEELDAIGDALYKSFGLTFQIRYGQGRIDFDTGATIKINELIAQYVPPCMQCKLLAEYRGRFKSFELDAPVNDSVVQYATVTEARLADTRHSGKGVVMYDITVGDNHNFLAGNSHNGFLVHNCTPGGSAPEFYSSVRIALGRTKLYETVGGKKQFVGQDIATKVVKTKHTKPFQETSMRMWFDDKGVAYFDRHFSLVEFLKKVGALKTSGSYVEWTDGKKYFPKALVEKLKADPTGLSQLRALIPSVSPDTSTVEVNVSMDTKEALDKFLDEE